MPPIVWQFFVALEYADETIVRSLPIERQTQTDMTRDFSGYSNAFLAEKELISYNGDYKADDDSLLVIEGLKLPDIYASLCKPDLPPEILTKEMIERGGRLLALIACGQNRAGQLIAFQRMSESVVIRAEGGLLFSEDTLTPLESPVLVFQKNITALYQDGKLFFESLRSVSRFLDISEYLLEASDIEMKKFQKGPYIFIDDEDGFFGLPDSWLRKKVHSILQSGVLSKDSVKAVFNSAKRRGIPLGITTKNGRPALQIPADRKKAKRAIQFLAEDILDSPISERMFLTNSKIVITK